MPGTTCAAGEPIEIGAVLPISGGLELFGEQARVGIDLAVTRINASGGIRGRKLKVLYRDNRTDPRRAVQDTLKLVRDQKVLAVIGPITSAARNAMVPVHKRYKTPLLYATNYEGGTCDRYVFSFNSVPDQELSQLIPALFKAGGKKIYMVGTDYAWPHKSFRRARAIIRKLGGKVVGQEYLPFGADQFSAVIGRIADSDANVVLKAIPGAEGISFVKQLQSNPDTVKMTVGYLGLSEVYMLGFDTNQPQNLWVTVPFAQTLDQPAAQAFVKAALALRDAGLPVSHYMMSHYIATLALSRALSKARKINRKSLIANLEGLKLKTPAGPVSIGKKSHHATMPMYLANSKGDQLLVKKAVGSLAPHRACRK